MSARIILRAVARDSTGTIASVIEQEMPATMHALELALRRSYFRDLIAECVLRGGIIQLEQKQRDR